MPDLIVAAGTVLKIDAAFAIQPQYDVFRMEANSTIRADVDLTVTARRAEFAANCIIDASGEAGTRGVDGVAGVTGGMQVDGGTGGVGGPGGFAGPLGNLHGTEGLPGVEGAAGHETAPVVTWRRSPAHLLWVQKQDMGPGYRMDHAIAFDPARRVAVLFGGSHGARLFADTWEWDGQLWVQVADTGPTQRLLTGLAYDPVNAQVLLFGGSGPAPNGNTFGDTWLWDGQVWLQVEDAGPSPRMHFALATDPVRRRVVLFGGQAIGAAGEITLLGDTWEWDGTEWTQRDDVGPSRRAGATMAYDPVDGRLLLFGGSDGALRDDTWGWDGSHWKQIADIGPRPRIGHAMASHGSGVIVFGGQNVTRSAAGRTRSRAGRGYVGVLRGALATDPGHGPIAAHRPRDDIRRSGTAPHHVRRAARTRRVRARHVASGRASAAAEVR